MLWGVKIEVLAVYAGIVVLIAAVVVVIKMLRKRFAKKADEQKAIVNEHKMPASIFVLEKKKGKITDAKLPKNVLDQVPAIYKLKKMPLVVAKVGPQIVTLICEENVFSQIPEHKNVNVEVAGIFIVSVKHQSNKGKAKSKRKRK
ncbi:MAG: hypothetical protein JXK07_10970 [Spirochaetes bacterium]|nr:hypothetical protein [Spirochaetota bacterium]MBN2772372.1 hypothetical protein [Spirochaetota bacterium]